MTEDWQSLLDKIEPGDWRSYRRAVRAFRETCPSFDKLPKAGARFVSQVPGLDVSPSTGTWHNFVADTPTKPKWIYTELLVLIWGDHHGLPAHEILRTLHRWSAAYRRCGGDPGPRFPSSPVPSSMSVEDVQASPDSQVPMLSTRTKDELQPSRRTGQNEPMVSMRELVTAQERTISAYEEMNRAWHAWEVSERGRVQAVQVGAMVFAMLGESKARVAALERRIDAIGSAPVETAVDELNLLRQDLQRAKHQEMALQERLARAEHERDRAQRVADFAARRAHDLEVELVRISGSIGTSTDSNRTEFAESRIERVSRSTKQLDDVELALEKIDFVLDRGHEEIQLAADGLGWTKPVLFGLIGGERIEAESNEISGQTAPGRPTTENDSARRVLALAQQVADQAIAEARTEANKIVAQAQKEVDDLLRRQQDLNAESSKVQDVIEPLESPEAPDGLRPTSDL